MLRLNYGHYVASESTATATANNPVNRRINQANRTWTDLNRDFVPDCDLTNSLLNGECGPLSAPLGDLNIVTKWDEAILRGWGVRPNDDEILIGFQQQLTERLMADVHRERHGVLAGIQRDHTVLSLTVGEDDARTFDQRGTRGLDRDAWEDGAARISDDSSDFGSGLRGRRRGTDEKTRYREP